MSYFNPVMQDTNLVVSDIFENISENSEILKNIGLKVVQKVLIIIFFLEFVHQMLSWFQ